MYLFSDERDRDRLLDFDDPLPDLERDLRELRLLDLDPDPERLRLKNEYGFVRFGH